MHRSRHEEQENGARDVAARNRRGSWRQQTSAHVAALQAQLDRVQETKPSEHDRKLVAKGHTLLEAARDAAEDRHPALFPGSKVDRALSNINEAELILLQLAPPAELEWQGPVVLAKGMHHLGESDPRLKLLTEHLRQHNNTLDPRYRALAVSVLHAANHVQESEVARVRNFRNVLLCSFVVTTLITALFILSAYQNPSALADKLCFDPPDPQTPGGTLRACPTGSDAHGDDVLFVASLGTCAAALTGAASIRHIQGTVTPYMVPASLLLLRLPIGALSALLGLVLIHGEFIPGLTALDSGAQIAAWAIVFGIGQEGLTRMIDRQGDAVLENVRGSWRGFDSPPPKPEIPKADIPPPEPRPRRRIWPAPPRRRRR